MNPAALAPPVDEIAVIGAFVSRFVTNISAERTTLETCSRAPVEKSEQTKQSSRVS